MPPTPTTPAPPGRPILPIAAVRLLGFFLVANLYLLPGNDSSPRLTDALGAALWVWAAARLAAGGVPSRPLVAAGTLALLPAAWGVYAGASGLLSTTVLSARWLLAVPYAVVLAVAAAEERGRRALLWGVWWGLAANLAVLGLQYLGWRDQTIAAGLAAGDSELVWGTTALDRNPGLHGHPNASAAVVSLAVPVALLLQVRHGAGLLVLPVSFLMILVAGHITATRAPLIVSAASVVAVALTSRRLARAATPLLLVAAAALPFYLLLGAPGGRVRWTDTAHTSANYQERIQSNVAALTIAVENPLGLGLEASEEAIQERLDAPAAHNAFLHLAMVYGPAFGALLLLLLGSLALRLLQGVEAVRGPEALLAFHVGGLFLFEEHLRNPSFVIVALWLGAAALLVWVEAGSSAQAPFPAPRPAPGARGPA